MSLITIKTYRNRIEAELAKGILESEGIKVIVSGDDAGGAYPALLLVTGGVRLLIKEEDAQKATEILESFND